MTTSPPLRRFLFKITLKLKLPAPMVERGFRVEVNGLTWVYLTGFLEAQDLHDAHDLASTEADRCGLPCDVLGIEVTAAI